MRVDEHTIYLDDSPVYYRSAETSGMPTLYLHGIPTSSDDWPDFLAYFTSGRQAFMYEETAGSRVCKIVKGRTAGA